MFRPQVLVSIFINIITSFVVVLLGMRLVLKFFAASTVAPFVGWVYETTQPLLTPFIGMFPSPRLSGLVIEFSSLFALIVYATLGYFLTELIDTINHYSLKLDKEDKKDKK